MTTTPVQDVGCGVFRTLSPDALVPDRIHRFVVGEDTAPRALTSDEAAAELADPFATLVLLRGTFPRTAGETLTALADAAGAEHPLSRPSFFMVGEGSQIPFTPETGGLSRRLRFLVSAGQTDEGADVLIASFDPEETDVELMAWDDRSGGFNYYRTVGQNSAWVFAGNSRHALLEHTEFKGPFESHTSGNFIMKELRFPWLHWHSTVAPVPPAVLADDDPLRDHPWFISRHPGGAYTLEEAVAKPGITRWTKARFAPFRAGEPIDRPVAIMRQILGQRVQTGPRPKPAAAIITSHRESRAADLAGSIDLPQTFFVDSEALTETLELQAPPPFEVSAEIYLSSLETFDFHVTDGRTFSQPGDTHFAFAVPERAFEDTAVLSEAIDIGLISRRFAACLLMTDFANPIFSPRREALLAHVPARATVTDGTSTFSDEMAEAIVAASDAAGPDSPEAEFAQRWATGDSWPDAFNALLGDYYSAVTEKLQTQECFDAYCELAESRRDEVRKMPIFETPLLFAETNIPPAERFMSPNGTVREA